MKKKAMLFLLGWSVMLLVASGRQMTRVQAQVVQLTGALSTSSAWTSIGEQVGGEYAYAVDLQGDYNGDGCHDLLLGAPKNSLAFDREGIVQVFYGSPNSNGLAASPDHVFASGQQGSGFGGALAAVGDVNGDGYDDALIGAYAWQGDELLPNQGAAFLYYGSANGLPAAPDWQAFGGRRDAEFGYAVAPAGDVNGDGKADLLIGARYYMHGFSNEGAAYLFLGNADLPNAAPDWSTYGGQSEAMYGGAVSGVGDVNGDGYDDVLVGAPGYKVDGEQAGAVFLFYGSDSGLNLTASWIYISPATSARLGGAVGPAGDLNGDGYADFLVGMPGYDGVDGTLYSAGGVLVFYGSPDGPAGTPGIKILGDQTYAYLGFAVGTAGDVDLDGTPDVLYGAYNYTDDQPEEGFVYLASGMASGSQLPVFWTASGDKSGASMGFTISAGDVNGDGLVDLAVGAPYFRSNTDKLGKAFLFLGYLDVSDFQSKVYLPILVH